MRTLLIGVLAATPGWLQHPFIAAREHGSVHGRKRLALAGASRPVEPAPLSRTSAATTKPKSNIAARAEKRSTAAVRDGPQLAAKNAKPAVIDAKVQAPASGRPAETSDPVVIKAKATIAAKLEDPPSAEFGEMKRAMRKNTLGKSVDTICGRVKGKKASGEGGGD